MDFDRFKTYLASGEITPVSDAAANRGGAAPSAPSNPDFESKHPRGNSANKGQFRKSEKTLAKLDEADAALSPDGQTAFDPAAEYAAVEAKYKGTPQWMKAPNGEPTNLSERQWVQVRTPSFKAWFGDWEAIAEEKSMSDRLNAWVSDEDSIEWAKGKSLSECEERLGSEKAPIAYLPSGYLFHFSGNAKDNRIYTSRGYLIDHIANHKHDDVGASEYRLLQQMFLSPDEVIKDTRPKPNGVPRDSLLFVKRFSKNRLAAVELSEQDGHIVLHKSLYNTKDRVYPSLPRVVLSGGGRSPISHAASATPGGSLSARDTNIVSNFFEPVNPAAVSKIVDSNGEPKVVYHGSTAEFSAFDATKSGRSNDTEAKLGFWFAESESFADAFAKQTGDAKVYSEFLNIRNPITFRGKDTSEAQDKLYHKISEVRKAAKQIEDSYKYSDTEEQSVFQLACNDDEFSGRLLSQIRRGHPEYDGIVQDAEKWRGLTAEDSRLTAEMDELQYSDSYELMRTEIAKTVGASARDANFGGLGMAYDNKGKSAGLYREKLMAEGYDGVVIENTRFDRSLAGGDNTQIVAFEPNQIKSATSNSGAFSPAKESILDSAPAFNRAAFLNYLKG